MAIASVILGIGLSLSAVLRTCVVRWVAQARPLSSTSVLAQLTNVLAGAAETLEESLHMTKLRALWAGELPLGEAFWTWAIGIGLLVNLTTTVLFLALITFDRPWAALFVGHVLSVPYNVVARSACGARPAAIRARPRGRPRPDRHGRDDAAALGGLRLVSGLTWTLRDGR